MSKVQGSSYTFEEVYKNAVQELRARKEKGSLTESDFNIIATSTSLQDVLDQLRIAIENSPPSSNAKQQIRRIGTGLLRRFERFGTAIDMLSQSSPQIMGVSLIGLTWGSLKFLMIIAGDISDTFSEVLNLFYDLLTSLPTFEIYIELFGSSRIQMLLSPLTDLFAEFTHFALLAIQLYDRAIARTIWRSTWASLHGDFEACIRGINKAAKEVDRIAQIEHMVQTREEAKYQRLENQQADNFRQELRRLFAQLLSTPLTADKQLSLLPFNSSPQKLLSINFTGRSEELDLISSIFQSKLAETPPTCNDSGIPTRYAIYGMPGVGKTQLALKYATISFHTHRYSFVFWISAASIEKVNQGVTKLLALVGHPDRYHPDQSVSLVVAKRWLEAHGLDDDARWLLVLDNVDKSVIGLLQDFLPSQNSRGHIIITTRTEDVARDIVDVSRDWILELQVPGLTDSATLLMRTAGVECTTESISSPQLAEDLVKCVGCLPLAVAQAASFMKESRKTPSEMLNLFDSREKIKLLSWNIPNNTLSPYEERSVTATFKERFKQIAALPDANSLLQLLSFLDTESIQLDMISGACKALMAARDFQCAAVANRPPARKANPVQRIFQRVPSQNNSERHVPKRDKLESEADLGNFFIPEELLSVILSPAQLQGALHQLQDLSLVTLLDNVSALELRMHDLTKFMVQELTMDSDRQAALFEAASTIICNAFRMTKDRKSPEFWSECESIVPHIEALTTRMLSRKKANRQIASINVEVAGYFWSRGRYKDAERLYRQALGSPEEEYNSTLNSTELITVLRGLAGVLVKQGQYDEAEKLYQRALADKQMLSRDSDMESLVTAHGLIEVYDKQGRYRDAVDLGEIVLKGIRGRASKRIPDLLQTMHNLGLVYGHQAQFDKAEEMFQYVMEENRKMLGADHPDTLRTINALANLYDRWNRYEEAAILYMQAMDGREKQFGPGHPQTLRSVCGLANLYLRIGLFEEAKFLYTRALDGSEMYFAVENPDVLRAVHGIASVLTCQDDLIEAEGQFKRAIAGRTVLLGEDNADTLRSTEGLATVFDRLNQCDKAVELYHKVHAARTGLLGPDHPETLKVGKALAVLQDKQRKSNNSTTI